MNRQINKPIKNHLPFSGFRPSKNIQMSNASSLADVINVSMVDFYEFQSVRRSVRVKRAFLGNFYFIARQSNVIPFRRMENVSLKFLDLVFRMINSCVNKKRSNYFVLLNLNSKKAKSFFEFKFNHSTLQDKIQVQWKKMLHEFHVMIEYL